MQRQVGDHEVEAGIGEGQALLIRRHATGLGREDRGEVGADDINAAGTQQGGNHTAAADIEGEREIAHDIVQSVQQAFGDVGQHVADRGQGRGRTVAMPADRYSVEHHHRPRHRQPLLNHRAAAGLDRIVATCHHGFNPSHRNRGADAGATRPCPMMR